MNSLATPHSITHVTTIPLWTWQLYVALAVNVIVQAIHDRGLRRAPRRRADRAHRNVHLALQPLRHGGPAGYARLHADARPVVRHRGERRQSAHAARLASVIDPERASLIAQIQQTFEWQLRLIILAGLVGTIVGSLLLPTFTYLYVRGVRSFERTKSVPHSLAKLFTPRVIGDVLAHVRIPRLSEAFSFSTRGIPRRLLVFNVVVTGVYAIGVVAAYYAIVLDVNVARTAIGISGIINGIGTIAFTFFVDPTSSIIVDQAIKGKRPTRRSGDGVLSCADGDRRLGDLAAAVLAGRRDHQVRRTFGQSRVMNEAAWVRFRGAGGYSRLGGCSGSVENWILNTRVHQGDVALESGNVRDAELRTAWRCASTPTTSARAPGTSRPPGSWPQRAYSKGEFDDALAT